ncbi:sugar transferase [Enterococcus sp. LJL120]
MGRNTSKEETFLNPEHIKTTVKLMDAEDTNQHFFFLFVKRAMDIVGGSVGLILSLPILLVVWIMMKKEEPTGPFLFSQTRVGKNGKTFKMYKIRSMCVDAEAKLAEVAHLNEIEGAMFKAKEDPRVTKIGKIIRKTSIDELPQFVNVIHGDMSLVGPRPPLPREVKEYTPYDTQRLLVKPGCTGLWQVRGRNDVHFNQMVEWDIEYVQTQSISNDIKIILKTITILFGKNGAY